MVAEPPPLPAGSYRPPGACRRWLRFASLLLPAAVLVSCGSSDGPTPEAKLAEIHAAAERWMMMRQSLAEADADAAALESQVKQREQTLAPLRSQIAQVQSELDSLNRLDAAAAQDVKNLPPDTDVVIVAARAEAFLRDFPLSSETESIRVIAEKARASAEQKARELAEKQKAEAARRLAEQKALDAKFRSRKMTAPELKAYLAQKTQQEVLSLLGEPTARNAEVWAYTGSFAVDEAGKPRGINVFFIGGRVQSVGLREAR